MKKIAFLSLFLLMAFMTQADLVDNFVNYTPGNLGDVASPPWLTTEGTFYAEVASESGANYLTTWGNGDYRDISRFLAPDAAPIEALSTLYLRVMMLEDNPTPVDVAFGLTQGEAGVSGGDGIGAEWYADYGPYFRIISNGTDNDGLVELSVRNGGGFVDDLAYLNVGQWYNFWLVIDPAAGNHDLYYAADGQDPILARADNGFRFAYANPLQTFLVMTAGSGTYGNPRVTDIHVVAGEYLGIPVNVRPYDPTVEQGAVVGTAVPVTLKWKAGADPDGISAVNPAIVDEYLFMGTSADPNLVYVGATGIDPGTEDPDSEYPTLNLDLDTSYSWAIVEALDGYTQSLTPGDSIDLVDPNNIIGPTWSFDSTKSAPVIDVQPADVRVFETDPSAQFTVEFTSLVNEVSATWYKDDVALSAGGDISIDTDPYASSTLTIATPSVADEGKYYCILSVQAGTEDDIQTATRMLVIKKLLAQFDFEQNLNDTSGNNAPTGQGKSVAGQVGDPNELLATDVALTYTPDGIQGYAVSLDGAQFINLGTEGYPKAGPLDTIGDIRGAGYEKSGFGRGMDQGSILCWVKLASDGIITSNANAADATHYGLTTNGIDSARIIIRGNNFDDSGQNLGEANGALPMDDFNLQDGLWHMFAATWADSTARIYIDGEQVAENTQGYTEKYVPWEHANLIGASRLAADRLLLNQNDFLTGSLDSLRVYNYVISADDIASEYIALNEMGYIPCADHNFDGNAYNFDNSASSYCKVDLADFAVFAQNWLKNGLVE